MKLLAVLVRPPFLSVNNTFLFALSILNSGIKINPPVLKLAERVVARICPPSEAAANALN